MSKTVRVMAPKEETKLQDVVEAINELRFKLDELLKELIEIKKAVVKH